MSHPPAGITDRDWEATPPAVRALVLELITQLARCQLRWRIVTITLAGEAVVIDASGVPVG